MQSLEEAPDEPQASTVQATVRAIRHRFLKVNNARLERAFAFLNSYQQAFLDALPLMLHVNHALLPGYVGNYTPAGVALFEPDKRHIRATRSIANAFHYTPRTEEPAIHNISVMGSIGTLAHSRQSDMDFWICHSPTLTDEQLSELELKLNGIQRFAEGLGLEVYFFLMNAEQFRQGQRRGVSGEDCGSAQHYLLLDEFYRTGLMLAGRPPAWWMVPLEKEKVYDDYLKRLASKQVLMTDEAVDFGGIPVFPAGEFIGAGMWQLYKGIESPYKSVIKIMLTEVYASEYPTVEGLSLLYKDAIYRGTVDLDALDPYVMLYRKIEKYLLKRDERERLELLRKCFYLKINEMMSRPAPRGSVSWKRQAVARLLSEWGWDDAQVRLLDDRRAWRVSQVVGQRKLLVDELNASYRFLSRFAKDNGFSALINDQDMSLLGRKLYAAFERKPGKIDYINPNIAPSIAEDCLSFLRMYDTGDNGLKVGSWAVFSGPVTVNDRDAHQPIRRSRSVVELLAWCYFNGLIDGATRFALQPGETELTEFELRQVLSSLQNVYPERLEMAKQEQFRQAARVQCVTLFINIGIDPMSTLNRRGYQRITAQTDSLNFSGLGENLVLSIEQVRKNTWHEVSVACFDSDQCVVDCVLDFMQFAKPDKKMLKPRVDIFCFGATRPQAICRRIEALLGSVIRTYYTKRYPLSARYVLSVAHRFYVFQFRDQQPHVECASSLPGLLRVLGGGQSAFSPIVFDKFFHADDFLKVLARQNRPNMVQIFFRKVDAKTLLYVFDELGSLVFFCENALIDHFFLWQLKQFFGVIEGRCRQQRSDGALINEPYEVHFSEVSRSVPVHLDARQVPKRVATGFYHAVKVAVESVAADELYYTVFCDRQAFAERDYGEALFKTVATYLLAQQRTTSPCPVVVEDLTFSGPHGAQQTSHYLQQKLALERQLNRALGELR